MDKGTTPNNRKARLLKVTQGLGYIEYNFPKQKFYPKKYNYALLIYYKYVSNALHYKGKTFLHNMISQEQLYPIYS